LKCRESGVAYPAKRDKVGFAENIKIRTISED
jgi:hypothetical protein